MVGRGIGALDESAWQRPTRLPDWSVSALVAHHAMFVRMLGFLASQPVEAEPSVATARDMLRRFNEPDGVASTAAAAVSQLAREQAASSAAADFESVFRDDAPRVLDEVRAAGPIVIDYLGNGTFPLAEAVSVGILEAVVHGLDLRAAVDGVAPPSDGALDFAVELLASLADPMRFIDTATGRTTDAVLPVLR